MKRLILLLPATLLIIVMGAILFRRLPTSLDNQPVKTTTKVTNTKTVLETVASRLSVPWSLTFTPDGRLLFTERTGAIRVIENGKLLPNPMVTVGVASIGEGGALGLATAPDFSSTKHIFIHYTYQKGGVTLNKVARLTERNGLLVDESTILDNIPGASVHNGGRIKFGPDQKLYVTTGDANNPSSAQDRASLAGKILRINPDGSTPADNPFPGSPVYSLGHRNPQGLSWHPITGELYATEHGSQAHDELNLIKPGNNYGWPKIVGTQTGDGLTSPLVESGTDTWAPSGASFYNGSNLPETWRGQLYFAGLRSARLWRAVFGVDQRFSTKLEGLYRDELGRLRDVAEGPDGYLYLATSNQDGRGQPTPEDDRILRIKGVE